MVYFGSVQNNFKGNEKARFSLVKVATHKVHTLSAEFGTLGSAQATEAGGLFICS